MRLDTKYSVGDVVLLGNQVFYVKRIHVEVGLVLLKFNDKEVKIFYSLERPNGADWFKAPESVITRKGTTKDWVKAGGKVKERCDAKR